MPFKTVLLALVSVVLSALAQITLRKAMLVTPVSSSSLVDLPFLLKLPVLNPYLPAGVLFFFCSLVLWLVVLSTTPVSLAYPIASLTIVLTTLFAWLVLDETVSGMRVFGVATICIGVLIVSRSG